MVDSEAKFVRIPARYYDTALAATKVDFLQ